MKRKMTSLFIVMLIALLATSTLAFAQEEPEADLWQTIQAEPRLDNFELLVAAGALNDNLAQDGPFTVFAPTNEAMAAFDRRVEASPANRTEVLLYHVANGYYEADAVAAHDSLTTLLGDHVDIATDNGSLILDGTAQVVESNIIAGNGVIHLIDTVLIPELEGEGGEVEEEAAEETAAEPAAEEADELPPAVDILTEEEALSGTPTLSNFLLFDDRFDLLLSLLNMADLMDELENRSDFTLFAPTDAAFAELSAERLETLMEDEDELRNVLLHHVIGDSLSRDQIATDDFIPTLSQGVLIVEVEDGIATVSGANFVEPNIELENGTLHVIDTVLNP
ncbi:MAG TPA: fasciclin domain-containing protein [Anaerolineae bacterium]